MTDLSCCTVGELLIDELAQRHTTRLNEWFAYRMLDVART